MEDEIGRISAALGALRAVQIELQRSNEDLAQFAYAASHDLNAPLRALADNPSGSFWQRTVDSVSLWFE